MKKAELIFFPSPGAGHLFSMVEMAKILLHRDERLSITVLIVKLPVDTKSLPSDPNPNPRLKLIDLPNDASYSGLFQKSPAFFLKKFVELQKPRVREILAAMAAAASSSGSAQIYGIIIDMFCTAMIDLANEFAIPTYVFFASGASLLGLMFHIQALADEHNEELEFPCYKNSDAEFPIPGFANPVPASVIPTVMIDDVPGYDMFLHIARRIRETGGVIINTFTELEPCAVELLSQERNPPIYPVGPVLNLNNNNSNNNNNEQFEDIMSWLDSQPSSSVVFLCFGSMGSFDERQVKEIAFALENSGHRFLWSLRKRPPPGQMKSPSDYTNPEEILPEGFLERTQGIGKVIGWAPQVAVLSHPAVGGFVSHCGWNSTLESVWFGVPMATWPLYAEQQMNAFLLVKELGMAVDIKMDFRGDLKGEIANTVSRNEIEGGIRQLMKEDGEIGFRNKVKDIKEKSRAAIAEGGSSYTALGRLVEDIIGSIA